MKEICHETDGNNRVVKVALTMDAVKGDLEMRYTLRPDGTLLVEQDFDADKTEKGPEMFRFGMQMQMPERFNHIEYHGRGPINDICPNRILKNCGNSSILVLRKNLPTLVTLGSSLVVQFLSFSSSSSSSFMYIVLNLYT